MSNKIYRQFSMLSNFIVKLADIINEEGYLIC